MTGLEGLLGTVSDVVRGPPLLVLLFGTHLYLTLCLRVIQRFLPTAMRLPFARRREGTGTLWVSGVAAAETRRFLWSGDDVARATCRFRFEPRYHVPLIKSAGPAEIP